MSFLSSLHGTVLQGYAALQGTQAQPQSANETLNKLLDRLKNSTQHEDRRSSLLGIKSMARDWKLDVSQIVLPTLLDLLSQPGLSDDLDMVKALLETLNLLFEFEQDQTGKQIEIKGAIQNIDSFLMKPEPTHAVLSLLNLSNFYIRFFSLQLLSTILTSPTPRPTTLESYLLTAPGGLGTILSLIDDTREIIRNQALLLLLNITDINADIQKIIAFEGGFDRLFRIIHAEGGISAGGIVVQDCLLCIGQLLKYNVSNQNYFRETSCIQHLAPMLLFPPMEDPHPVALDSFATQPWTDQKLNNALLVLALARTLVSGAGNGKLANQRSLLSSGFTRYLAEIGLASLAPPILKSEALNILSNVIRGSQTNQEFINKLVLSPLTVFYPTSDQQPVDSDREPKFEFHRLPPQSAILALFSLTLEGIPGTQTTFPDHSHSFDELCVRSAALSVITSFLEGNLDAQLGIVATMNTPIPQSPGHQNSFPYHSPGSLLFAVLQSLPAAESGSMSSYTSFFASLIFAHLVRGSEQSKQLARQVSTSVDVLDSNQAPNDNDDSTSLVHILIGNLMMAQRMQSQSHRAGDDIQKSLGWARIMVGYLIALSIWLWESPLTTSEFLSEGTNLQVLIDPIGQSSGVDPLVQGLCAFVLGIIYETNHDPACAISRSTLYSILQSRVGPDQLVNRILRLREDNRFKSVGPDVLELNHHLLARPDPPSDTLEQPDLWFDWPFVEFFKNHYLSIQQSFLIDPGSSSVNVTSLDNSQQDEIITHLKRQLTDQSQDFSSLQLKLEELSAKLEVESKDTIEIKNLNNQINQENQNLKQENQNLIKENENLKQENQNLIKENENLNQEFKNLNLKLKENEQELEDLLILLEDVSNKSRKYKLLLRQNSFIVSDDDEDNENDVDVDQKNHDQEKEKE